MCVDIEQLPIPDWGLSCPHCQYPLRGLPEHRCPECGLTLVMEEIVQPWTRLRPPRFTGRERPLPDFGLTCPACGAALAGAVDDRCPACAAPFNVESWRPGQAWFKVDAALCPELPMLGVMSLLAEEQVPYAPADERGFKDILVGEAVFSAPVRVPMEFFFEVCWLLGRAVLSMHAARAGRTPAAWTCPHCRESNPGPFDVCWNCERSRAERD